MGQRGDQPIDQLLFLGGGQPRLGVREQVDPRRH